MRKLVITVFALLYSSLTWAADGSTTAFNFSFENADITAIVKEYAKATGQKFIIDPSVHGKITIINSGPVAATEAFNQLSSALALNSLGISQQEDTMVIMQARALQRNDIEVVKEAPPLKPERMYTWVVTLKHASAEEVNRQVRVLSSKDGEVATFVPNNQLYISDWSSNMQRMAKIIAEIDTATVNPIGQAAQKKLDEWHKANMKAQQQQPRFTPKNE